MPKIRPEGAEFGDIFGIDSSINVLRIYFCVIKSGFMIVGLRKIINSVGVYLMVLARRIFHQNKGYRSVNYTSIQLSPLHFLKLLPIQ